MCPNVIIRQTMDYTEMVNTCYAGIRSCDKFPTQSDKLTDNMNSDLILSLTDNGDTWINLFATR